MKIYSGFTFYNEFDLLELRLREMYNYVDYFIIVEANCTFTSCPKSFNLETQWDRYAPWQDKIRYVKVTDMPNTGDAWANETYQRNQIMQGCTDAAPNDIIIIGDVDEILRPEALEFVRQETQQVYPFRMPLFNFKFNYMLTQADFHVVWPIGIRRELLDNLTPDNLRRGRHGLNNTAECVDHSGWHFTWFGDNNFVQDKLRSFSHTEANRPEVTEQVSVETSIAEGLSVNRTEKYVHFERVRMDSYMPKTITDNLEQYTDYILPDAEHSALDFLPAWQYN